MLDFDASQMLLDGGYSPLDAQPATRKQELTLYSLTPIIDRTGRSSENQKQRLSLPCLQPSAAELAASSREADPAKRALLAQQGRAHFRKAMREERVAHAHQEAAQRYIRRARQLNSIGIFDSSVNTVRARLMTTTEFMRWETFPAAKRREYVGTSLFGGSSGLSSEEAQTGAQGTSLDAKLERQCPPLREHTEPQPVKLLSGWNGALAGSRRALAVSPSRNKGTSTTRLKISMSTPNL
ncbi:hypothetical protein AB1Y20_002350 [Prymnesium parvum]|uniref:Uncharacterized protein n=1 Tax=Prymnesium parvum TaxID=97485 RepID=A0AB34J8W2_PRYPA